MKNEQDKHRHHKQPQFYLKGFAAKSSNPYQKTSDIWVYKKGVPFTAGQNPHIDSVKNVGYEDDLYAFVEDDGTTNHNKYENLLEKEFEKPATPVIEKIRNFKEINVEEKEKLSRYIASMITRGNKGRILRNFAFTLAIKDLENREELEKQRRENYFRSQ